MNFKDVRELIHMYDKIKNVSYTCSTTNDNIRLVNKCWRKLYLMKIIDYSTYYEGVEQYHKCYTPSCGMLEYICYMIEGYFNNI